MSHSVRAVRARGIHGSIVGGTRLTALQGMGDVVNTAEGLRGRKKRRTREQLIQAAIEACRKKGFDDTTVREIVDSADVSLRTFSRYFPTKESVIIAVVDDCARAAAARVSEVSPDASPLEALYRGHMAMLADMTSGEGPVDPLTLAAAVGIVGTSPTLRRHLAAFHSTDLAAAVAARMGTTADDRSALLVLSVWIAVVVNAFHDPVSWLPPGWLTDPAMPGLMVTRINESYRELMSQLSLATDAMPIS